MNIALQNLFNKYKLESVSDYENAAKEIIQHLSLLGLWRSKFFEHAAFYGGTCLRIFYGLQRFSEDLDFSLVKKNDEFDINPFIHAIESELESFGFIVTVSSKKKIIESQIESAFIKGNTKKNLIYIETPEKYIDLLPENKKLKIKLEIDVDPPGGASFDVKTLFNPIPFSVKLFSPEDLFAGKLHAVLCRKWKNRTKGRDLYDFIWYISQNFSCNLLHLKERMVQTGHLKSSEKFDKNKIQKLLLNRMADINLEQAKDDVSPFIQDSKELELWTKDFFIELIHGIEVV